MDWQTQSFCERNTRHPHKKKCAHIKSSDCVREFVMRANVECCVLLQYLDVSNTWEHNDRRLHCIVLFRTFGPNIQFAETQTHTHTPRAHPHVLRASERVIHAKLCCKQWTNDRSSCGAVWLCVLCIILKYIRWTIDTYVHDRFRVRGTRTPRNNTNAYRISIIRPDVNEYRMYGIVVRFASIFFAFHIRTIRQMVEG